MTLSADKTHITHIDDGFDFLGFRIRRKHRNDGRVVVLTYPSKAALAAPKTKIKGATGRGTTSLRLEDLLRHINPNRAGLGSLGPLRRLQENLLIPGLLVLVETHPLDTTKAPQPELQIRPGAATSGRTGSAKTVSHS